MDAFIPGITLTIIGMCVVFGSLLILMAVIVLLERFVGSGRRKTAEAGAEDTAASQQTDDLEIILAAAAGYFLETESPEVYVPPVRRGADSAWARTARVGHLAQRRRR